MTENSSSNNPGNTNPMRGFNFKLPAPTGANAKSDLARTQQIFKEYACAVSKRQALQQKLRSGPLIDE